MEYGLSLGSNKGDRLCNLKRATGKISDTKNIGLIGQSSVYETEPVDVAQQHEDKAFLNCVIIIETDASPEELLATLQGLEAELGRPVSHGRNAPRTIDIDIIYADRAIIDSKQLTIPHPRWSERRFVIEPLAELRPDLILPGTESAVKDILNSLPETPKVALFESQA